ncbi:methyltransferase domain-containing protein [Halosimplex litoreum]|uniref:Methyltransferase domain-containing protein n=1 Tax=Halosimplex litoreum TaxID=1198301 RepID=A0A7T3FWL3_9EURY|nr:class I SAM-dependent methyltransferase [Halosimplex litoreum]QPV62028.1 methyltransferase domain-containing protein [Halosimplex litoreum]
MTHAATRYLESKRSVDDRARSRRVRDRLLGALPDAPRVLEAGCGTGVTVANLVEWGVDRGEYRGIDRDPGVVAFARAVRPRELRRRGHAVAETPEGLAVDRLAARFETGDALAALADERGADLFVAQAFADLVPLPALLDTVETALAPGGLAYLPITFDGGTVFQPDHPADDRVERAYHEAIDDREGRDVRAGRHLIDLCRQREGDLLAVDGSDWVARPRGGRYPADERHFLDRILGFVADALSGEGIEGFDDWLATRREQLRRGELTYVAHQYDLLYRTPER